MGHFSDLEIEEYEDRWTEEELEELGEIENKYQLRDFMFKQFMKDPSSYMKYVESVMFDHYTEIVKDYHKYDVAARLKIGDENITRVYEDETLDKSYEIC